MARHLFFVAIATILAFPRGARAHDEAELPASPEERSPPPEEVEVHGARESSEAASQVQVGATELRLRPRSERFGNLVEAVPGLFTAQHSGGGKADQYFLRGFDADHGTDVAFFVDGVPVNLPSHAHGQGFSDLHFVIPEMVVGLVGFKGPYYSQFGDFATAGAVTLHLADSAPESFARLEIGQYGMKRALLVESPDLGDDWRAIVAAEVAGQDGPFVHPEDLTRAKLYARVTHDLGPRSKLSLTWMSYGSTWNGSGQIPARAVCGEGEVQKPSPRGVRGTMHRTIRLARSKRGRRNATALGADRPHHDLGGRGRDGDAVRRTVTAWRSGATSRSSRTTPSTATKSSRMTTAG